MKKLGTIIVLFSALELIICLILSQHSQGRIGTVTLTEQTLTGGTVTGSTDISLDSSMNPLGLKLEIDRHFGFSGLPPINHSYQAQVTDKKGTVVFEKSGMFTLSDNTKKSSGISISNTSQITKTILLGSFKVEDEGNN